MTSLRLALISTPRSGNTWVRSVLADVLGLHEVAVHSPREIPTGLPERVVLQLHWKRERDFEDWLAKEGFRILALARHPLDVLLSVLHFVRKERQVDRWLDGQALIPPALSSATPVSSAFRQYALSEGAAALLNVSASWWSKEGVLRARYEDLVAAPEVEFGRLVAALGGSERSLQQALARFRLEFFQSLPNRHGWRGQSGMWRQLITPLAALQIYWRHRADFRALGYDIRPYLLSARSALSNWNAMEVK
ncbi:MAG: hypothetical protein ACLP8B_05890 [Xanthobacteraceae bacterium]